MPDHWLTFGTRTSPLSNGPRLAAIPGNALLNYLYAVLEGTTTAACQAIGLDPGMGPPARRRGWGASLVQGWGRCGQQTCGYPGKVGGAAAEFQTCVRPDGSIVQLTDVA